MVASNSGSAPRDGAASVSVSSSRATRFRLRQPEHFHYFLNDRFRNKKVTKGAHLVFTAVNFICEGFSTAQ
jgi:hypothetical protein